MIATAPEQITRVRTAADNMGMSENPLVSGSSLDEEELLVALELELAEAGALVAAEAEALNSGLAALLSSTLRLFAPLSSKPRSSLAEDEALLDALAEAVEAGLAVASSMPRSSKPRSSEWATAAGAKTNTANATDITSNTDLRTVSPLFACATRTRMQHAKPRDLCKFTDISRP